MKHLAFGRRHLRLLIIIIIMGVLLESNKVRSTEDAEKKLDPVRL